MNKTVQYTVWVGGSEIGTYTTENEAEQVWDDWRTDGYDDVEIEEHFNDELTPEQMNDELRSLGF